MGRDIVGRTLEKKIMRQLLDNDKSDFLACMEEEGSVRHF